MSAVDYIKSINTLCDELLRSHSELLSRKNICRKQDLIQIIKIDLDKLTHALLEVKENRAPYVLGRFFGESSVDPVKICEMLATESIYHFGFEIHEPLDLVLYGINHWIEQSRRTLGADMRVHEYLRFPASQAFQTRVGAYTEIMRIWLKVSDRVLMLELFDIHRPSDGVRDAPKLMHRNFHGLFRYDDPDPGHQQRLAGLFARDGIWHYAFYVKRPAEVMELHREWQGLAARDPNFIVPYAAAVHNTHDGSFHTKIIQSRQSGPRMELEFVTQYAT